VPTAFPRHALALDYGEPLRVYYHSHIDPAVLSYAASQSNIDYLGSTDEFE
jgi:hypothetical protein